MLGVVRDSVQARLFGAGDTMDAFVLATRIPTLLRDLFAEGAMSAAFVPTFTRYLTNEGKEAAWRLGSQVINGLLVVTTVIVIAGILLADPLTHYFAPEFSEIPNKHELAVWLTRINMPFLILLAVAAAFMGMLNALRRFLIPSLSPATYNVVFIVCALVFTPLCRNVGLPPITSLAIGFIGGGIAQAAIQWPAVRREGYRHRWVLNPRDRGLREILLLMGPGTIGVAAAQINLFVNTVLATSVTGAVSALSYAFRLMYVPIGIVGVSVATAAIPDLARHAAGAAHAEMRRTLSAGLRMMFMLSVPATIGLMVLARPIVELVLESGEFSANNTDMTAAALMFYAPGILGYSIVKIASPSFYALRDSRTPVLVSITTVALNLALNLSLYPLMGFQGLALGTSIAASFNALVLLVVLGRRIGGIEGKRLVVSFWKIVVAAAAMGAVTYLAAHQIRTFMPDRTVVAEMVRVFVPIAIALVVLAAASMALRIEEFGQAMRRVLSRVGIRG